jgi:hypothetical protein
LGSEFLTLGFGFWDFELLIVEAFVLLGINNQGFGVMGRSFGLWVLGFGL